MQNKTYESIDINTLKFLYERYKDFTIPFIIVLASILLFAKIVLPSLFDFFDAQEKQKVELKTLTNMENKLSLLKSVDDQLLDSQLAIVSKALPIDKDFASILNAISDVSNKSNVSIESFKFSVGDLSEEEGKGEFTTLGLDLTLNGSTYDTNDFIGRLNSTLPLSEINNISATENLSDIEINFYYKQLSRSKPDDSLLLVPVSAKGLALINEISSNFSVPQSSIFDLTVLATPTAINPNPFE